MIGSLCLMGVGTISVSCTCLLEFQLVQVNLVTAEKTLVIITVMVGSSMTVLRLQKS